MLTISKKWEWLFLFFLGGSSMKGLGSEGDTGGWPKASSGVSGVVITPVENEKHFWKRKLLSPPPTKLFSVNKTDGGGAWPTHLVLLFKKHVQFRADDKDYCLQLSENTASQNDPSEIESLQDVTSNERGWPSRVNEAFVHFLKACSEYFGKDKMVDEADFKEWVGGQQGELDGVTITLQG